MNQTTTAKEDAIRGQLHRLMLSALDFRHALSAATFLLEDIEWSKTYSNEDLRRFKCYETTMVVAYARPFTTARGHAAPFSWKLVKANGFELTDAEKGIHQRLMDCRNQLHAHSDYAASMIRSEVWRTPLPDGRTLDFLSIVGGEQLVFEESEVQAIHTFLWKVRHHVDEAVQTHPAPRDDIPIVVRDVFGAADTLG